MKQRLLSIQVIRALAFILIFLSHAEVIATGPIGVSLFLVISGFCMTYAYLDREDKIPRATLKSGLKFAAGKVRKLYPLHIVTLLAVAAMVFGGLILHKAALKEFAEQGAYFVANALLLQSWIPLRDGYFSFNAVSWYLSTTAFAYFLFPWVFRPIQSKKKRSIVILAAVTLGLMAGISVVLGIGQNLFGWSDAFLKWVTYIFPLYRAGDFIIGLVAGYVFVTLRRQPGKALSTVAELVLIAVMTVQVILYVGGLHATNWMLTLFWLPTSVLFVFFFAYGNGILSSLLSKCRPLVWLGNISGEAFLIHQISIKAVEAVSSNKVIVTFGAFALTLVCTVIWRLIYKKVTAAIAAKRSGKTA